MRLLTIDFEGSLKKGIREIGFVVENKTEKIRYGEIIIENEEHSVQVLNEVLSPKPELIISHNVHVEKNLIKKYLPYSVKNSNDGKVQWGPWIDTRILYKSLYPKLNKFDLEYLTQIFVFSKVSEEAKSIPLKKRTHHNALFDALCTYYLYKRLSDKINIYDFIQ